MSLVRLSLRVLLLRNGRAAGVQRVGGFCGLDRARSLDACLPACPQHAEYQRHDTRSPSSPHQQRRPSSSAMVKTTMPAKPDGFAVQAANVDHLLQAVREGNVATVQSGCASLAGSDTRLSREAAASIKDSLGRGLLHVAAHCGHCNIIDYLVSDLQMLLDAQDDAGGRADPMQELRTGKARSSSSRRGLAHVRALLQGRRRLR